MSLSCKYNQQYLFMYNLIVTRRMGLVMDMADIEHTYSYTQTRMQNHITVQLMIGKSKYRGYCNTCLDNEW